MPSVTSLDQDMRKLRLERYTPSAAKEVKAWIEDTLGEALPTGDPLESLRDGVALCKLANMVIPPPGIKFKASSMPFTQRENISHFLAACERPPLNMPAHDRFLTVDLYDGKDPAQVIQCIGAFSRAANAINPSKFPTTLGPKRGAASPTRKTADGNSHATSTPSSNRPRGVSNTSLGSMSSDSAFTARSPAAARTISPAVTATSTPLRTPDTSVSRSDGKTSSWSRKTDEGNTAPAWNIHQYGYMGGASQGNQGISFGGRRQIIGNSVEVPNKAEKDARLRQQEIEEEQARQQALEEQINAAKQRQAEAEAEEARARAEEQERWAQATREAQERERRQAEEAEQEERRQADQARAAREREQREVEDEKRRRAEWERKRQREEEEQARAAAAPTQTAQPSGETERIKELERQLAEAKERERQYQLEREQVGSSPIPPSGESRAQQGDSAEDERSFLQDQYAATQQKPATPITAPKPVTSPRLKHPFSRPMKPFEPPRAEPTQTSQPPSATAEQPGATPGPNPYQSGPGPEASTNRTDRFLSNNFAPQATAPTSHHPSEMGLTSESERRAEDQRREASQAKTKAGGWASKSLLEREMERERERQREWEESQMKKMGGSGSKPLGPRAMGPR